MVLLHGDVLAPHPQLDGVPAAPHPQRHPASLPLLPLPPRVGPVVLQEGRVQGGGRAEEPPGPGRVLEGDGPLGSPAGEDGLLGDEEVASAELGLALIVVGAFLEFVRLVVMIRDEMGFCPEGTIIKKDIKDKEDMRF